MSATTHARRRALKEWVRSAELVVGLTEDAEALSVLAFLQANAFLAEPRSGGDVVSLDDAHGAYLFAAIPLLVEDADLGQPWTSRLGHAAWFEPSVPVLFLRCHEHFTSVWQGILVLHEGHHARTYLLDPYDWTHEPTYFAKERDTHAFQNRLVSILGGLAYRDALQQEMDHVRASLCSKECRVGEKFLLETNYPKQLDPIFGPAVSESEVGIRIAHWLIHVNFALLERELGDTPSMRQLQQRCVADMHRSSEVMRPELTPAAVDAVLDAGLGSL